MRTKIFQIGMLASICLGMTACSSDDDITTEKAVGAHQPIQFSSNLGTTATVTTRAAHGFAKDTKVFLTTGSAKILGVSEFYGTAAASTEATSTLTFDAANQPYWDNYGGYDAWAEFLAYAIVGTDREITRKDVNNVNYTVLSFVDADQSAADYVDTHDLVYARATGQYRTATKKFDVINLPFKHALSKLTVNLIKGDGFAGDFSKANTTVKMLKFCTQSRYDISTIGDPDNTSSLKIEDITAGCTSESSTQLTYKALFTRNAQASDTDDGLEVKVGNYTYTLKKSEMIASGKATDFKLGQNYTLNLTLTKAGMSVQTYVTDFENTDVALTPITANASSVGNGTSGTTFYSDYIMYRSTDVNKGYESALTATYDFTKSKYNFSNITYWPDQTTAYNFRAVSGVTAADNEALHTNDANNDYIDATTHVNTYTNNGGDLCIGAPYNDDGTLASASTETSGNINLLFKHLKTAVDFRVKAKDNIDLTNATLTVHNVQTTGKYLLGDLSFTPTGSLQDVTLPICSKEPSPSDAFGDVTFFMFTLPQALNTEGSKVSITITTANGSKYNLDISDLISTRPAAGGGYEDVHVNSWISGMEYGMIINLYKTGINNVTATMTDWENGGTANPNIHLLPWGKK